MGLNWVISSFQNKYKERGGGSQLVCVPLENKGRVNSTQPTWLNCPKKNLGAIGGKRRITTVE
jgi:hypothetical protein